MGNIIGRGVSRKLILTGRTDFESVTGGALITESIQTLLLTRAANPQSREGGARVFRRNIGLRLLRLLFNADSPQTRAQMKQEVLKLTVFEPRIMFGSDDVTISKNPEDPNVWLIGIKYNIVATGERKNQVFPIFAKDRFAEILPVIDLAA